jgi:hypothetical protein
MPRQAFHEATGANPFAELHGRGLLPLWAHCILNAAAGAGDPHGSSAERAASLGLQATPAGPHGEEAAAAEAAVEAVTAACRELFPLSWPAFEVWMQEAAEGEAAVAAAQPQGQATVGGGPAAAVGESAAASGAGLAAEAAGPAAPAALALGALLAVLQVSPQRHKTLLRPMHVTWPEAHAPARLAPLDPAARSRYGRDPYSSRFPLHQPLWALHPNSSHRVAVPPPCLRLQAPEYDDGWAEREERRVAALARRKPRRPLGGTAAAGGAGRRERVPPEAGAQELLSEGSQLALQGRWSPAAAAAVELAAQQLFTLLGASGPGEGAWAACRPARMYALGA